MICGNSHKAKSQTLKPRIDIQKKIIKHLYQNVLADHITFGAFKNVRLVLTELSNRKSGKIAKERKKPLQNKDFKIV